MMKLVIFMLSTLLSLNSFCQKNQSKIVLTKGQHFVVKTTISQDVDMGMGMGMKNATVSQNIFTVINSDEKKYTATNTLTGLKISMDMMGQQLNYDSDKKEDSASEIGKSIPNLNIPDTFSIDKYSGTMTLPAKPAAPPAMGGNPLEAMFESAGDKAESLSSEPFFIIPAGKKSGDSWIDSSTTKDSKSRVKYLLQSIDKNLATIIAETDVESNTITEVQGMQVTMSRKSKSTSDITVDTKTGLVQKKNTKTDITGNLDMMDQSVPVNGKITSTMVFEY